jgi:hypothetical protein
MSPDELEIIGWLGSILLIVSLLQRKMLSLRLLNLAASSILVLYNTMIGVWPMIAMNAVVAVIDLFYIVRIWYARRQLPCAATARPTLGVMHVDDGREPEIYWVINTQTLTATAWRVGRDRDGYRLDNIDGGALAFEAGRLGPFPTPQDAVDRLNALA